MISRRILTLALLLAPNWASPTATSPSMLPPTVASSSTDIAAVQVNQLARSALNLALDIVINNTTSQESGGCTMEKLRVRRDWRAFSRAQKRAYIESVLCLTHLPSSTPAKDARGAKNRYDDFVAVHIVKSDFVHRTGAFLSWHRYFVHGFEQTLRNECGYTGDFPYWNWGADTEDMTKSEVFDGSDTSLSGNGAFIPNQPDISVDMAGYPRLNFTAGTGGGCMTSGPFQDYTVDMGPSTLSMPGGNVSSMSNPLDYNPRCLKRSLTTSILQRYANYTAIAQLILNYHDIWDFETVLQGVPGSGLGVHGGGHYAMGGDPGRDMDVSPADPAFWHHHGMIDRVWWIWQHLDLDDRQQAISGTGTFMNQPPSPNTTLDTMVDLGLAVRGAPVAMRELMSTTAGPFCYVYL
ncbi:uncharacterized protein PFLUO_LOCUS9514 [Penicillium psychrofluorescens]|uniref:uncharacterized protein n=1 Tax=Penicillium psychrofluorescens TaxID=3158075 RepID=UPI003CCE12CA